MASPVRWMAATTPRTITLERVHMLLSSRGGVHYHRPTPEIGIGIDTTNIERDVRAAGLREGGFKQSQQPAPRPFRLRLVVDA